MQETQCRRRCLSLPPRLHGSRVWPAEELAYYASHGSTLILGMAERGTLQCAAREPCVPEVQVLRTGSTLHIISQLTIGKLLQVGTGKSG